MTSQIINRIHILFEMCDVRRQTPETWAAFVVAHRADDEVAAIDVLEDWEGRNGPMAYLADVIVEQYQDQQVAGERIAA